MGVRFTQVTNFNHFKWSVPLKNEKLRIDKESLIHHQKKMKNLVGPDKQV